MTSYDLTVDNRPYSPDILVDEATNQVVDVVVDDRPYSPDIAVDTAVLPLFVDGEEGPAGPLPLPVVQPGQTVWDLGLSETRCTLWVNGVRYFSDSYSIDAGILTWYGAFPIRTTFTLFLT